MENASKALLIAGAILLSILIIAIGMYIYTSSQNSIQTAATQISAQEVDSFNQTWQMYEGVQTGANVKTVISKLTSNASSNADEETRLPDLYYEATANEADGKGVTVTSTITDTNVSGFNTARTSIQSRHEYTVTLTTDASTSLVNGIIVTYNKSFDATSLTVYTQWSS